MPGNHAWSHRVPWKAVNELYARVGTSRKHVGNHAADQLASSHSIATKLAGLSCASYHLHPASGDIEHILSQGVSQLTGPPPHAQLATADPALETDVASPGGHLQHEPDVLFVEATLPVPKAMDRFENAEHQALRRLRTRNKSVVVNIQDWRHLGSNKDRARLQECPERL